MDTLAAFAMGMANKNKELMVFDWDKAANIIKDRKPHLVVAGLAGDMEYTSGVIYKNGKVLSRNETYTYLSSTWAIPTLVIDNREEIECYKMKSGTPNWDSDTYWPQSSLDILNS
mgnify:FL=1